MTVKPKTPTSVHENGMGHYEVLPEVSQPDRTEGSGLNPAPPTVVVHTRSERARGSIKNKLIAGGLVFAVAVGGVIFKKATEVAVDVAPKPERTLDIDDFKQAMDSRSSVANGEVESTADVRSTYKYLLGSAECEFEITGTQPFAMTPQEGSSNITVDHSEKEISVELGANPIEVRDQIVSMPGPEVCTSNAVGDFFDDNLKAYGIGAERAPGILEDRTSIGSDTELRSLEEGRAGRSIAAAAAGTYESIAGRVLDLTGSDYSLEFEYQGQPISPESQTNVIIDVDGGNINTRS